jgi:hypothetical protein
MIFNFLLSVQKINADPAQKEYIIDLSELPTGLYLVEVTDTMGKTYERVKLVKK